MKQAFLDKLIQRLDRLDPDSLQTHFLHLSREKGLLETIFHAMQEGLIVLDREGRMLYANRAAEKLLGFSLEKASGDRISRYLRGVAWERVLRLDEGEWARMVSREIEIDYPEHRFLAFYVVPLALAAPKEGEEGAVVILRDVTRERENEATVMASERLSAVTLLAAGVAHEIGNPLNALNIHLQLLERELRDLPDPERENLRDLVDIASKEVTRLDQIINQFLRAVRPSRPDLKRISLADVLHDALEFLRREIENKDILVEVEVAEDLPPAHADANMIRQAFFNIMRNAVQAMPDGGLLKINLTSDDRFLATSFRDSGPGIAPEDLGRLFEAYHTTKDEGSGLGLMIVQRIVRDHGGELEVDSEPGAGSTFTILLPRHRRRTRLLKASRPDTADTPDPAPENEA